MYYVCMTEIDTQAYLCLLVDSVYHKILNKSK